jgi:hypothetical protein
LANALPLRLANRLKRYNGSPLAIRSALSPPCSALIRRRYHGCTEGEAELPEWEGKRKGGF